jgi:hypothetical protein
MERSDKPRAETIADELLSRMLAGKLDTAETEAVVNAVLVMQADRSVPWSTKYGDLIDQADLNNRLTKAQRTTFCNQGVVFRLETRPTFRPGDRFPAAILPQEARLSKRTSISVRLRIDDFRIGDQQAPEVGSAHTKAITGTLQGSLNNRAQPSAAG